ncbi:MAG: hypothetical protein IT258_04460, partial [Saprospiraceae bacterium]|nr:hypothetical protein [Saprospiraceae bacterium]
MKRLLAALLLVGALTNTNSVFAQSSKSTPSRISLSAGVGLFPTYYKSDENKGILPLNFKVGYDISKAFSLGLMFGYSSSKSNSDIFGEGGSTYITNRTKVLGLRAEFHKEFGDKVIGYGGSMVGLYNTKV